MKTLRVILAAFVIAGVSACGQIGPLYLPDRPPPTNSTAPDADLPTPITR